MLVGGGVQLSDTCLLGNNIHFAGTVPAHLLAGRIDASVTHCGEGTVQTACLAGVPFAGIAMQAEQSWNIEECVRYGNALRFTKNDVRRGNMRDILDRLLSDESMRAKARQLGALWMARRSPLRRLRIISVLPVRRVCSRVPS